MKHLRNLGFGKKDFQTVIADQARELVDHLGANQGRISVNNGVFSLSAVNLIWALIAGRSFKRGDRQVKESDKVDLSIRELFFLSPLFHL